MSIQKMFAILLIVAGSIALVYGGFSYTKETHEAEIGSLSLSVDEREYISVPVWAGVASIAVGVAFLLMRKSS